jgi:hypothetical protein
MKKLLPAICLVTVVLTSCGPAAEDRVQMDRVAKRMSDSLKILIDTSLSDPNRHINFNAQPAQPQPAAAQPTAAPNK